MGKLEGRIKAPTGGWDTTVGGATATLAAGTYYISSADSTSEDFLAALATVWAAAASTTCSITISAGENGTGIVTVTFGSAKAIAWVDTEVRDLLGFADNSASATTHIGTMSARALWLPSCHYRAPDVPSDNFKGLPFTDTRMVMNKAGYAWHVAGQMNYQLPIEWPAVTAAKTRISQESTTHTSFERFWRDNIFGSASWAKPGGPVRFYPNAATDSTYIEYRVMEPLGSYEPQPLLEGLPTGPHRVAMRLLAVGDDPFAAARLTIGVSLLTSDVNTTDATSISTASVDPADDAVLYAAIQYTATATTPTVTGNGLTWVEVHTIACGASDNLSVFRAQGSAPSAGAITFDFGATTQTGWVWAVVQCTNVDTSGTNGSGATNQSVEDSDAAVTTLQLTLSALENSNNVMLAFYGVAGAATCTPDAQFAELMDLSLTSPTSGLSCQWAVNQTVCDPTFSASTTCCGVAIEVKAG